MTDQYNYKKTVGDLEVVETWDEIGIIEDDQPTGLDPQKEYEITTTEDKSSNGDGTYTVTKRTSYSEIQVQPDGEAQAQAPEAVEEDSVEYSIQWQRQEFEIDMFDPFSKANFEGANADFLSGKLVCAQNGSWGYPPGVQGITFAVASPQPDNTIKAYKRYKDGGVKVTAMIPTVQATIKVKATYNGELLGNAGIPPEVAAMATNSTTGKPTNIPSDCNVIFKGETFSDGILTMEFMGSSISNSASSKSVLVGGAVKTRVIFTIVKQWVGNLSVDSNIILPV